MSGKGNEGKMKGEVHGRFIFRARGSNLPDSRCKRQHKRLKAVAYVGRCVTKQPENLAT
jgi:hypothetical protein